MKHIQFRIVATTLVMMVGMFSINEGYADERLTPVYILSGHFSLPNKPPYYDAFSIWQIDENANEAALIYQFIPEDTPQDRQALLSELEYSLLSPRIRESVSQHGLNHVWQRLWQAGDGSLVILSEHYICNYLDGSMADRCRGYYEFLSLDPHDLEIDRQPESLVKLDYHVPHPASLGCFMNANLDLPYYLAHIRDVVFHPQDRRFVVTSLFYKNCYGTLERGYSLLVDFRAESTSTTRFDRAGDMAWSPDGKYLAYTSYTLEDCTDTQYGCFMSVNLYSVTDRTIKQVAKEPTLPRNYFIVPVWSDNDTIEFPYYKSYKSLPTDTPGEPTPFLQYNLLDGSFQEKPVFPVTAESNAVLPLRHEEQVAVWQNQYAPFLPENEQVLVAAFPRS